MRMKKFQYFGLEDSVYNHLQLIQKEKNKLNNKMALRPEALLNKRYF
jgi:hypothetical protein